MDIQPYLEAILKWLSTTGLRILVVIIIALVALRAARLIANRLFSTLKSVTEDEEKKKRADTLSSLIRHVLNVAILAVALIMILAELGIEIGPILAAAGIVGLAVGFGAQNLVQDIIGGFFVLMEDQIRVGDVVQIAGKDGVVEKVNLRMVVLRDLAGNVHYVRNGKIEVVTNMTKEFSQYVFDIGVAYREDIDEVIEIIREVGRDLCNDSEYKDDILDDIEILGLDQFADSAVVVKARIKTRPIKQWRIGREFNRRLKKKFDEKNIEIPFPHMTVYMGEDKQGQSPALNVSVKQDRAG